MTSEMGMVYIRTSDTERVPKWSLEALLLVDQAGLTVNARC